MIYDKNILIWIIITIFFQLGIKHQVLKLIMTTGLLRQLFKEIRILETKNQHIASITRKNIRLFVQKQKQNKQKNLKNGHDSQNIKNLSAFIQLLAVANKESQQFSQNQKIKLVEMCCNINVHVNSKFQIREDRKSKQLEAIYYNSSFQQLKTQNQKKFVLDIMKKVYHREQTFDYPHLNDFFLEKRLKKSTLNSTQHLNKLDEQTKNQVMNILNGKQIVSPYYRQIYEYYFTETPSQQITFSNYLNSLYILLDFDDTAKDWISNSFQKEYNDSNKEQKRKQRWQRHENTLKNDRQRDQMIKKELNSHKHKETKEKLRQQSQRSFQPRNRKNKY